MYQSGINLVAGRTYKVSYWADKISGGASNLGYKLTTAAPGAISHLDNGTFNITFPSVSGYVEISNVFTCTASGSYFLIIGGFGNATQLFDHYYFVDDVSIVEVPDVSVSGPLTLCSGENSSVTFTANSGSGFSWGCSPFHSGFSSSLSSATFTAPASPGTYTVTLTATTVSGCTSSVSFVVTVISSPFPPSLSPVGPIISCNNQPVTLNVSTGPAFVPSIVWYLNSTSNPIPSGNGLATLVVSQSGTYFVSIQAGNGCKAYSNQVVVNFVNPPFVTVTAIDENCVLSNDGSATAFPNGGTAPYAYLWSTGGTTQNIAGLDVGNYSVTVTDANGCTATAIVTIGTQPDPAAPVITASVNNLCSGPVVTYQITNFDISLTYSPSGVPTPVSITNPVTGLYIVTWPGTCTDVVFTITGYNGNPVCPIPPTSITTYACCPCNLTANDEQVSDNQNGPYLASTLLATSPNANGNIYSNPSGILYINGVFVVDVPSLVINASRIRFGGGARIELNNNSTFVITNNAWLAAGCNVMWNGIHIDDPTETVIVNSSLIEDMENGLVSDQGGVFQISSSSQFNKNYKSLVVKNYLTGTHPGTVEGTKFTCYQQAGNPVPAFALIAPHAGERSYIGIEITDVKDILIGNPIPPPSRSNLFDNLNVGVGSLRSSVTIKHARFQNMTLPPVLTTLIANGRAIWAVGEPGVTTSPVLRVGDVGNFQRCHFFNCGVGVFAEDHIDVYIKNNRFNNHSATGIFITHLNEINIVEITNDNRLIGMPRGIWCYDNPITRILIDNNSVNVGANLPHQGYGIIVQDLAPQQHILKTTTITNNNVTSVRRGIFVVSQINNTLVQGNTVVCMNTPFANPANYTEGIELANTSLAVVTDNEVYSASGSADWWMNGIRVNLGSSNIVTCNYTHRIGRGLYFDGDQTPFTGVAKNDMRNNETGLLLNGNIAAIGPQGFNGQPYDNKWLGGVNSFSSAHTNAWNGFGALSPFFVRPNPLNLCAFPYYPCGSNMTNLTPPFEIPFATTTGNLNSSICPFTTVPFAMIAQGQLSREIIAGTKPYPIPDAAGVWMSRYNLYKYLQSDSVFLNSDPAFVLFLDSCKLSNVGMLDRITKIAVDRTCTPSQIIGAIDTCCCQLISPVTIIEGHYVTLNRILLSHALQNTPLDSVELDTLRDIARLCPLTDGPAVIIARSVVARYDVVPTDYSNACEQTPQFNNNRTEGNPENNILFNLYPNPSSGEMTLDYFLPEGSTGTFIIRDVTGKFISTYTLLVGENNLNIHESKLPNGVYLYEITQNGKIVKTQKLVVAK